MTARAARKIRADVSTNPISESNGFTGKEVLTSVGVESRSRWSDLGYAKAQLAALADKDGNVPAAGNAAVSNIRSQVKKHLSMTYNEFAGKCGFKAPNRARRIKKDWTQEELAHDRERLAQEVRELAQLNGGTPPSNKTGEKEVMRRVDRVRGGLKRHGLSYREFYVSLGFKAPEAAPREPRMPHEQRQARVTSANGGNAKKAEESRAQERKFSHAEENAHMFRAYWKARDGFRALQGKQAQLESLRMQMEAAEEALLRANEGLAGRIASEYHFRWFGSRITFDDLRAEAMAALSRAIRGFKPELGFAFSTYACKGMERAIERYLWPLKNDIRLPSYVKRDIAQVLDAQSKLKERGEKATPAAIAQETGMIISRVQRTLDTIRIVVDSTEKETGRSNEKGGDSLTLGERLGNDGYAGEREEAFAEKMLQDIMANTVRSSARREVLRERMRGDTLQQIAERRGITREAIRVVIGACLTREFGIALENAGVNWAALFHVHKSTAEGMRKEMDRYKSMVKRSALNARMDQIFARAASGRGKFVEPPPEAMKAKEEEGLLPPRQYWGKKGNVMHELKKLADENGIYPAPDDARTFAIDMALQSYHGGKRYAQFVEELGLPMAEGRRD